MDREGKQPAHVCRAGSGTGAAVYTAGLQSCVSTWCTVQLLCPSESLGLSLPTYMTNIRVPLNSRHHVLGLPRLPWRHT